MDAFEGQKFCFSRTNIRYRVRHVKEGGKGLSQSVSKTNFVRAGDVANSSSSEEHKLVHHINSIDAPFTFSFFGRWKVIVAMLALQRSASLAILLIAACYLPATVVSQEL